MRKRLAPRDTSTGFTRVQARCTVGVQGTGVKYVPDRWYVCLGALRAEPVNSKGHPPPSK